MSIDIQDNSEEVLAAFHEALLRGLEKCGTAYYMSKKQGFIGKPGIPQM